MTAFSLVLTLLPIGPLADFFELMRINLDPFDLRFWGPQSDSSTRSDDDDNLYLFRGCLLLLVLLHLVLALFIENLVENSHQTGPSSSFRGSKNKYKMVETQIIEDKDWPPLSYSSTSEILALEAH